MQEHKEVSYTVQNKQFANTFYTIKSDNIQQMHWNTFITYIKYPYMLIM